jgi:hypothetical protein
MLVDYRKFERKMRWREFFSDKEDTDIEQTPAFFPQEKSNLPSILMGVKSELTGTHLNKVRSNIPKN